MSENIKTIQQDVEAKTIINLHPSFAFKLSDYHSPHAFASMQAGPLIFNHMRVPASERHRDIALHFEVPNTSRIWPIVRNTMHLALKTDPAGVLSQQIEKYQALRREHKAEFSCQTAFKCIASFLDDIFYPAVGSLRSPLRIFVKEQRTRNPASFQRMLDFYTSEVFPENLDRYLSTLSDYFNHFDQFRQVLAYARVANEAVDDLVVGSKRFDEVKLYYGQAYESLTSGYTLLASLFNLSQGREFDQFAAMSLKKYMSEVDKAKRGVPFASTPVLSSFAAFEDSSLRNGSHHASIWREGELVKFRSGGAGAKREISFARYLHICNGITIALAALFLVELEFVSPIRPT